MKKSNLSALVVLFLSIFLIYQLIDLINYLKTPKSVQWDQKIEKPEIINLEDPKMNPTPTPDKTNTRTKPVKKETFPDVQNLSKGEQFQFEKKDYLLAKNSKLKTNDESFEDRVLNKSTLIEKTLSEVSQIKTQDLSNLPTNQNLNRDMERFALKIALPTEAEGTKFKVQYREPPDFGKSKLPDHFDQHKNSSQSTFTIEKTKAYESPWDNFSNGIK